MEIKDRCAVVTGAASGIGRATCQALISEDIRAIAVVDQNPVVAEVAAEFCQAGGREDIAVAFQGDTTDPIFRKSVYDDMEQKYGVGSVRICVPAAGITRDALAIKSNKETGVMEIYPVDTFRSVLEVNLVAPAYWAMEMVARIASCRAGEGKKKWLADERVQGTVIFIGSVSSQGIKGQISYAATKAGLEGVAATLSKEAIFHGVRCGVIHPGFTDTPMVRALGQDYIDRHILPMTQLGRLIHPGEIADAIRFMIANSAISGELWVDAGWQPAP